MLLETGVPSDFPGLFGQIQRFRGLLRRDPPLVPAPDVIEVVEQLVVSVQIQDLPGDGPFPVGVCPIEPDPRRIIPCPVQSGNSRTQKNFISA